MPPKSNEPTEFIVTFAKGEVGALELASVRDSKRFDFEIIKANEITALIRCTIETAQSLIRRLGGSYKIAKVYGNSVEDFLTQIYLPESDRFNWTISGYNCDPEILEQLKSSFLNFLKSNSVRKAKYLESSVTMQVSARLLELDEMKLGELNSRIIHPRDGTSPGLDLVVDGSLKSVPLYCCTEYASDITGFERRDFGRSYQDPTITISPRTARLLVNVAATSSTKTILDPFCGLGTILQEGLVCGFNMIGVDKSKSCLQKADSNLSWLRKEYNLSPKVKSRLFNYDARRLSKFDLAPIDAIATEPILLPKFDRSPASSQANDAIRTAASIYEESIRNLSAFIRERGRFALVAPSVTDDHGRAHSINAEPLFRDQGFKMYQPNVNGLRFDYPLKIESSKRKIINRQLFVACLA